MTPLEAAAILGAGVAAGGINTIVGSGSLITFPTLLALGYPPVVANVSNTVGLVLGGVSGAIGYRRELSGQRRRIILLGVAAVLGGLTGAALLLLLPESAFGAIVPVLILVGVVLVIVQPRLNGWLAKHRDVDHDRVVPVFIGGYFAAVYGGYFGAAQGVILIGIIGIFVSESLQRLNAVKNVTVTIVNLVAAVVFMIVADVAWAAAGLIALGSIAGGWLGARVGRKLPPMALRIVIAVVGVVAIVMLLLD